jgi:hypothetical protein
MIAALVAANLLVATPVRAADKTVAKLTFASAKGPLEVWLTRADSADGNLVVKVIAKGVGPKPQSLTIYSGGGDDDGPGVEEARALTAKVIELPAVGKAVRVDFTHVELGGQDEETETTLVGFDGKTHKLLELTTRRTHARSKVCREREETALLGELGEAEGMLTATTRLHVDPTLGDDDEPIDRKCVAPKGVYRVIYKWTGERYVDARAAVPAPSPSPSPMPAAPPAPDDE